jgi:prepilin-type N-terminal cleavage/methylation domain-containing protein
MMRSLFRRHDTRTSDSGFSLLELMITALILPIVLGAAFQQLQQHLGPVGSDV